jgi:hypothetical protein
MAKLAKDATLGILPSASKVSTLPVGTVCTTACMASGEEMSRRPAD